MSPYELFLLVIFGLLLVAAIFLFVPTRRSQKVGRAPTDRAPSVVNRDDERYWVGGIIYYNRDDPDLLVPKRFGWGWTVNFARPEGKVVLVVLLLLILLPVLLQILGLQLTPVGCHPSGCYPTR